MGCFRWKDNWLVMRLHTSIVSFPIKMWTKWCWPYRSVKNDCLLKTQDGKATISKSYWPNGNVCVRIGNYEMRGVIVNNTPEDANQ